VSVALPPGASFHHVGYACRDLDAELAGFQALGYAAVGDPFTDPAQGVTGLFCEGGGPRIELLAPLQGSDVLDPWLRGPARMYHLAYEVPDVQVALEAMTAGGARIVRPPVPAVAFDGRHITFLMLPNRLLVELIGSAR
jgi:methylmalonyl-CoA/ethylmalonyl-CoA epimerase